MLGDNLDDEIISEEEADASPAAIAKLRERLKKAIAEKQEYLEGWQRTKADFVNLKKDEETRREHSTARIKASLAEELVPTLDSFEMALKHSPEDKNLAILHKQLLGSLQSMGIERFGEVGEKFDPTKHEALQEVAVDTADKDHTVVTVERSGYSINNFIIRPAQVVIGNYKN
jgi:molecular chaperone GrpE